MENWTRQQWKDAQIENEKAVFYLYTPFCGTCQVASKMLSIVEQMKPDLPMGKADLNYLENVAVDYEIESVPCLLITENGQLIEKIYAFQSVPYLLEKIG